MSGTHDHPPEQHAATHDEHAPVPYGKIAATLLVFTVITVLVSFKDLGSHAANAVVAFLIAAFKASLVMTFFMHLKYEKRPILMIAMAPFILVAVLFLALFPDITFGQYHSDPKPAVESKEAPADKAEKPDKKETK
ncbi:MAG TPA: cytochrome C oxidase subunit IV family protein [Planctomycetota bacterium]|nr:cytochrome C oxidase subunit IV family protein [Planctomycetota bacterium]